MSALFTGFGKYVLIICDDQFYVIERIPTSKVHATFITEYQQYKVWKRAAPALLAS